MMRPRGIISPPRSRYYQKKITPNTNPPPPPPTPCRRPATAAVNHRALESQSTAVKRKPKATQSNNDNRSINNSTPKTATKTKTKQITNQRQPGSTTPSKSNVKAAITGSAAKPSGGGAKHSATKKKIDSPNGRNHLQSLSIHGKDLSNIDLDGNSIHEYVGSDTKEECSWESNAPRIFHNIYKEIASLRQGNSSNITSYFTKLNALWAELANYSENEKLSEAMEREKTMQFLLGLDDSYSTICAQILLMTPFPTMEKAYSVVIQEENHRESILSVEIVAAKVMQKNDDAIEEVDDNLHHQQLIEPFMTILAAPVRC